MDERQFVLGTSLGLLFFVYLIIVPILKYEFRLAGFGRPRLMAVFWPIMLPVVFAVALIRMFVED